MQTNKLIKILLKNKNGVTLNHDLTKPKHKNGFYVSMTNNFYRSIGIKAIKHFASLESEIKPIGRKTYIGFWFDEREGLFYLDITLYCYKKEIALNLAKKFKQKAIFDLGKMESVYL